MDARTERMSAGAKLMDDMEALEIENATQAETIRAYEVTINQMADKIDLLNRQLAVTQASEREFMNYANELGIQLRNNVAANVRALEIANDVAQRMKQRQEQDKQTATQSAEVEKLLMSSAYGSMGNPPLHVESIEETFPAGSLIDGVKTPRFIAGNNVWDHPTNGKSYWFDPDHMLYREQHIPRVHVVGEVDVETLAALSTAAKNAIGLCEDEGCPEYGKIHVHAEHETPATRMMRNMAVTV